jgi:hypothetical protein
MLRKYDPVRETDNVDWKRIYQSRNWVEKLLKDHTLSATCVMMEKRAKATPEWKVAGTDILLVVRDMIMENGVSTVGTMRVNLIHSIPKRKPSPSLVTCPEFQNGK